MIKAIFFDFDGVIVESVDIKTAAFGKLFEQEGKDISERVVKYHLANTGVSRFDKFRFVYKKFLKRELDDAKFRLLCNEFSRLVTEEVIKAPYVKGAPEFLKKHFTDYIFFVVSATPQKEIEEIMAKRGIGHIFKKIYGSPTEKYLAVEDALMTYEIKPEEAVYIGDALSDYKAAKDNGISFVARIKNNERLFSVIDCVKVSDLVGLKEILNDLNGMKR